MLEIEVPSTLSKSARPAQPILSGRMFREVRGEGIVNPLGRPGRRAAGVIDLAVVWFFTPVSLTGSSGKATAFTAERAYEMPDRVGSSPHR